MSLPEEEELEPVPEMLEGESLLLCKSICPRWYVCGWDVQYFDRSEDRDQAQAWFEEHWREHHG